MPSVGSFSENGWSPARVGAESLVWVTVPGTNVNLQMMKGWPAKIMAAFAADFNLYVEKLRDADSASWTPTNAVATSNHLNGTAMDLNWDSHPFRVRGTFGKTQMAVIREMLKFYEDTIFWAGDWTDPIDEMHWQMGYTTYNNPDVGDFIKRKIRANGFSTFRKPVEVVPAETKKEESMALSDNELRELLDKVRQLWGAAFNPVPSKSRYGDPTVLWPSKDFPRNDDGFLFDLITEHDASLGDPAALGRVQKAAANGDLIAQHFLEKLTEAPNTSAAVLNSLSVPANNVTCWNCGKHYPDALPSCPFCGAGLTRPEPPTVAAPVEAPSGKHAAVDASPVVSDGLPAVDKSVVEQLTLLERFGHELPPEVSSAITQLIPVLKGLVR